MKYLHRRKAYKKIPPNVDSWGGGVLIKVYLGGIYPDPLIYLFMLVVVPQFLTTEILV